MIRLDVWLTLPSGKKRKAGALVCADPDPLRGGIAGQFRYDADYLASPGAFALDPLHLPLQEGIFSAERPQSGVHGVFEDSLPDDWGRGLMVRRHGLGRHEQRPPNLLRLLGSHALGALSFTEQGLPDREPAHASAHDLHELARLATAFEQNPTAGMNDELSLLFQAGSSPGGARPKALVQDGDMQYIAKFASHKDTLDVVGLEAATMEMARLAGLETARTHLLPLSTGRCLLVKRFDVTRPGGRRHLISMQTLLKADGYYHAGYRELAAVIRHVSGRPGSDLQQMYRQMAFNAMVGNTDDHLKNFLMLHDENGWRLSPAFDLTPNVGFNRDHALRIGLTDGVPDSKTLPGEARHFGITSRGRAGQILSTVRDAVASWQSLFAKFQVPGPDALIIGADIEKRLQRMAIGL